MLGQILLTLWGMYDIYIGSDILGIFMIVLNLSSFGINILNLETINQ